MARVAALPMYDLPEIRAATDAWWQGLARALARQGLTDVPERLSRGLPPMDLWRSAGLLLAQTCGYPLTHALAGMVELVATPCYQAPGCVGPYYRSLIVVRADDPVTGLAGCRGRIAAINGRESHSGCNVLRSMGAALGAPTSPGQPQGRVDPSPAGVPPFAKVIVTGAHALSLAAVAGGRADVAAIDCVTHALLARHRPAALAGVRTLARSPPAPGLPYVTHAGHGADVVARLRAALFEALAEPTLCACRDALLLSGADVLPLAAYDTIRAMAEAGARP